MRSAQQAIGKSMRRGRTLPHLSLLRKRKKSCASPLSRLRPLSGRTKHLRSSVPCWRSDDEDIVGAVHEALAMAGEFDEDEEDDDESPKTFH